MVNFPDRWISPVLGISIRDTEKAARKRGGLDLD